MFNTANAATTYKYLSALVNFIFVCMHSQKQFKSQGCGVGVVESESEGFST